MKVNSLALLFFSLCFGVLTAQASFNTYEFDDPEKKQRFDHLINELRCTVCQNQTIADSDASLAKDLREKVYNMVNEGKTDQQIKDFMVERFTDFVLYRPPVKKSTYLLWAGPFVLLGLGILFLILQVRKRKQTPQNDIDEQQHQRVQALLKAEQKDHKHD